MAMFVDHHATTPMPPEMAQAAVEKLKSGKADENGVIGINAYVGATDTWCLTEAPNADAVHKGHEAMGINLGTGDIQEVQALV